MRARDVGLLASTLALMLTLSACATPATPLPTPLPPSATPLPPTETPAPTATNTAAPTETPIPPFPTGVFKVVTKVHTDEIDFLEDGTYRQKGGILTVSGTYVVSGNQVVLSEIKNSGACGKYPGTYEWSFDGQVLTLKTVENKCPSASIFTLEGQWTRQP